ncbi:hypothetical protein D9M70_430470 [compost metagenome]
MNRRLSNGIEIDVRVRTSPYGCIQWFIGVYGLEESIVVAEEFNCAVNASSIDVALAVAFSRACGFAGVEA